MSVTRRALLVSTFAALPAVALVAVPGIASAAEGAKTADFISLGDFTVNVPAAGRKREYLVLSITVETAAGSGDGLREISPRVQDAVLRRLMAMSEQGVLQPNRTDPLTIKDALYDTISKLHPDGVKDVLLTRILYS